MITALAPVRLYELDGSLLTAGLAHLGAASDHNAGDICVDGLDQPGRVILRCLLGMVRDVRVELGGRTLSAEVVRVAFDPRHGRCFVLRVRPEDVRTVVAGVRAADAD
jgi:hypothetical protein